MAVQAVRPAWARLDGVNRPDLLPSKREIDEFNPTKTIVVPGDFTPVLDVVGALSPIDIQNFKQIITNLERTKKVKLRVLSQNYPNTPGLETIQDYYRI